MVGPGFEKHLTEALRSPLAATMPVPTFVPTTLADAAAAGGDCVVFVATKDAFTTDDFG